MLTLHSLCLLNFIHIHIVIHHKIKIFMRILIDKSKHKHVYLCTGRFLYRKSGSQASHPSASQRSTGTHFHINIYALIYYIICLLIINHLFTIIVHYLLSVVGMLDPHRRCGIAHRSHHRKPKSQKRSNIHTLLIYLYTYLLIYIS